MSSMSGMVDGFMESDLDFMFPFFGSGGVAEEWMLFEMERSTAPQPWMSGTLLLANARVHFSAEHLLVLSGIPAAQAFEVMTKPMLIMSELVCKDFILGSGWAFFETRSTSLTELEFYRNTFLKKVRFMEYHRHGLGAILVTYEDESDNLVKFQLLQESDGRTNSIISGAIDRSTRVCTIMSQFRDTQNCGMCIQREKPCNCNSVEIAEHFDSKFQERRSWLEKNPTSGLGNYYYSSWMHGTWTICMVSAPDVPPLLLDLHSMSMGTAFDTSLNFVVQQEVLVVQPPQASQRFLYMMKDSMPDPPPPEDWSSVISNVDSGPESSVRGMENPFLSSGKKRLPSNEYELYDSSQDPKRRSMSDNWEQSLSDSDRTSKSSVESIYPCEQCSISFRRRHDLARHCRTVHDKKRDFNCEQCGKQFTHRGHLNVHIKVTHENKREFQCPQCDKGFGIKSKLVRHIQNVHENLRRYPCSHCNKAFKEGFFLRRHMARHHATSEVV